MHLHKHPYKHPLTVWLQCVTSAETLILYPTAEHINIQSSSHTGEIFTSFFFYWQWYPLWFAAPWEKLFSHMLKIWQMVRVTSAFAVMREGDISFAKLVKGRLSWSLPMMSMVELPLNSLRISSIIFQTLPFVLHFFCWSLTQCRLRIAFSPCSQTDAATARNNWDAIFASESLFVPVLWSASVQIVTGREHRSFAKMEHDRERR